MIQKKVPFYIRIRENLWLNVPGKGRTKALWLFNSLPLNTSFHYSKIVRIDGQLVYLTGMKTVNRERAIEFVIVASFKPDPMALTAYKDRWQVETMFKAFKSGGFNFEDTHLKDPNRIARLIALVCVSFTWVDRVRIFRNRNVQQIKIKKHGRRAYSIFKFGLIFIAHSLLNPLPIKDFKSCIQILSCTYKLFRHIVCRNSIKNCLNPRFLCTIHFSSFWISLIIFLTAFSEVSAKPSFIKAEPLSDFFFPSSYVLNRLIFQAC
ncbi:MAG: transposase [Bacteroidales bacterium]|nr:transposase [Bacteroidales bacterium]